MKKYFKIALFPWVALYGFILLVIFIEAVQGHFGQYGGLSSLFRNAGLYPSDASIFFWVVTGIGLFLAFTLLLIDAYRAAWRKWAAPVWEKWTVRYPRLRYARYVPEVVALTVMLEVVSWGFYLDFIHAPTVPMMVTEKSAAPIPERVLFQVPYLHIFKPIKGATVPPPEMLSHTIHGNAVVTQTGPNTYRIRMLH